MKTLYRKRENTCSWSFLLKQISLYIGFCFMLGCTGIPDEKSVESDISSKPNVLIILADDLGYGDLGAYNEQSLVPTPNLDTLALQGVKFVNAYCPIAVCSPSRYALMTGTYPWRSWNVSGVMRNYERSMMAPGQLTLPAMFKASGYTTAGFGKWHLGASFPTTDGKKPIGHGKFYDPDNGANIDLTGAVHDGPIDHGFEQWLGFSCASECWVLKDKTIIGAMQHDYYTVEKHSQAGKIKQIPMDSYLPMITKASQNFLKEKVSKKGKPFFLYYAPYVPHVPLAVSKSFLGRTPAGAYGDYVHELDFYIGELLHTLDSLKLSDNTVVLFASDNGSAFRTTYQGMNASNAANKLPGHFRDTMGIYKAPASSSLSEKVHSPNGALRGIKSTAWEGGVRSPLIVRWPGHFPKGLTTAALFGMNDVMATLAPLTGYMLKGGVTTDGMNLLPVFYGKGTKSRKSIVVQSGNNIYGLRNEKWKYIEMPLKEGGTYDELYNLEEDPSENHNLATVYPERLEQMKKELEQILQGQSTTVKTN
ncbi:arylsulfatase [Galbibacter sp. PAP.153]|uniref:sulfatase family protein n=1 Tax=Galbibacter sp. PAP.153 TaxID=3104623 RepID=UPI00300BD465